MDISDIKSLPLIGKKLGTTRVHLNSNPLRVTLIIQARCDYKVRRAIAVALAKPLLAHLKYIRSFWAIDSETSSFSQKFINPNRGFLHYACSLETSKQQLGFDIRLRRLALGISQKDLAEAIGITRSHLSEIEHGKHSPHPSTFSKLQTVLKIQHKGDTGK